MERKRKKNSIGDQLDCKNSLWESKIKLQWFLFLYIKKKWFVFYKAKKSWTTNALLNFKNVLIFLFFFTEIKFPLPIKMKIQSSSFTLTFFFLLILMSLANFSFNQQFNFLSIQKNGSLWTHEVVFSCSFFSYIFSLRKMN